MSVDECCLLGSCSVETHKANMSFVSMFCMIVPAVLLASHAVLCLCWLLVVKKQQAVMYVCFKDCEYKHEKHHHWPLVWFGSVLHTGLQARLQSQSSREVSAAVPVSSAHPTGQLCGLHCWQLCCAVALHDPHGRLPAGAGPLWPACCLVSPDLRYQQQHLSHQSVCLHCLVCIHSRSEQVCC